MHKHTVVALAAVFALTACAGEAVLSGTVFSDETGTGSGPSVAGARVTVSGAVDVTLTTASDGTFSLPVPRNSSLFVHLEAAGHVGLFEAEAMADEDRDTTYGLSPQAGVDFIFGSVGLSHDATKGIVVVDFQTDSIAGGESATLDLPFEEVMTRDQTGAFVIGEQTPAGGEDTFISFLNVELGETTVAPISPPGYDCTMVRGLTKWAVLANTVTAAHVGCEVR